MRKTRYQHGQYGKRLDAAADDRGLDAVGRSGTGAGAGADVAAASPSNRAGGASPDADAHLKGEADCSSLA